MVLLAFPLAHTSVSALLFLHILQKTARRLVQICNGCGLISDVYFSLKYVRFSLARSPLDLKVTA